MSKLDKKNLGGKNECRRSNQLSHQFQNKGGKNECRRSNQLSHQFQNKGGWTKTFKNPKQRKG